MGRRLAPLDTALYRLTGGRLTVLGPQELAMPRTCLLTTIGRRTGKRRTTPVMFLRDGKTIIVTSESFGQRRAAAWPLNLRETPRAEVRVGRERLECEARELDERQADGYWPDFVRAWPAHRDYLARSGVRRMFALHPVGHAEAAARPDGRRG
jgi:F420H(2)-dependent quinone reductase